MTTLYKFKTYYTKQGVGAAPSSAPVATVVDTDANTKLANAQATTALSNLVGYYEYEYSGADNLDLVCLFHTTDTTTDQQDLVSYVVDKVYQADKKLDVVQADLDNPTQYKADISTLAKATDLQDVENAVGLIDVTTVASMGKIDALDVKVNAIPTTPLLEANYTAPDNASIAAILEDTGTTIPATLTTIDNEIAVIDGNVDAILDDTGTSGVLLSTSALTSIFDDEVIVGTYNFSDLLKIMASALAGKLSGGGTTTLTFRSVDDTSDVIVTTVDANKNRTNVVITV